MVILKLNNTKFKNRILLFAQKMKFKQKYLIIGLILFILIISPVFGTTCSRQRCCLVDPCTSSQCIQRNSQSWISVENFADYQYTKLVLSDNQCKPCPYNCKSCSSETQCVDCANGFYMDSSAKCLLCSDRCLRCTVVNSITKCSSCQDGTYLDSNTLTCKGCPTGAKTCSSSTAIIQCQTGYRKSSNSLFCTSCPSNCLTCPISDTTCTSCSTGYYLNSSACSVCNLSNCVSCLRVSSTVLCSTCSRGFLLKSGACSACPSNCRVCSSNTVCTACNSGYFLQGGACSLVSTSIANCQVYSNTSSCNTCSTSYYLKNASCYSCSLLCATCDGSHFGQCLSCKSNAILFNKMCLITNFPSSSTYNLFYSFPQSSYLLSSGVLSCNNQYVVGSSIEINLDNLKAYKLQISWKVYSTSGSSTYSVTLTNTDGTKTASSSSTYTTSSSLKYNNVCDNNLSTYYHLGIQQAQAFDSVKKLNMLKFSTDNGVNIALHEIVVLAYRCNDLCIECSQTLCTQCLMTKLYTQDAYCVYTCSNNYYIYLNPNSTNNPKQCVSDCPLGSYTLTSNVSCVNCQSPCLTCLNQLFCLSCVDGYYLTSSNTCKETCPDRFYGKVQTKTCQKCVGRCLQCLDQEKCISCKLGFLYNTTKNCLDTCMFGVTLVNGLYADLTTLYCQACNLTCLNCLYQSARCTQCALNKYLYEYQCLPACPISYFAPTGTNVCASCQYPCKSCQNLALTCLTCFQGYLYSSSCVNDCPTGFYEDNVDLKCLSCDSKCVECYGSATYCLSCKTDYFYFQYQCYGSCPDGYYAQIISGQKICTSCVSLCRTCLNQTYCLSCKSNFLYQGSCLSSGQCPSGYFAEILSLSCKNCQAPCLNCQYSASYCTKCDISNINGLIYLEDGKCISKCSSTYYYPLNNGSSATCQPCEQPCLKCTSSSVCLSCIIGYKYSNNVCSSTCSIGTYFDSLINDCLNCSVNCQICTSSTFCQACENQFFTNTITSASNQCIATCPVQFYAQPLRSSCKKCIFPCQSCTSSIDCLTCLSGVVYQSRCISSCPDSTYLNITTNQCVSCQGDCLTCSSDPTYCESCKDGFYLYYSDHTCISSCPATYYHEILTKSCLSCPTTCSACANATFCTSCIVGKSFKSTSSNICVEYCQTGYFGNALTLICQVCDAKCMTCKGSASNCLSCSAGYLFIKLTYEINDCQASCPSGHYPQSSYCYQCSFPCKTCTSPSRCVSCIEGTFHHQSSSSCLLNCPTQTFYNFINYTCESCIYPCKSCDGNSTNCLSCSQSNGTLYLYNGGCIKSCPKAFYADQSGICNKCYGLCSTCQSKFYCLTCLAGYVYDGFCYSSCPLGTYANTTNNNCQNCDSVCTECILSPTYCTKCSGGLYVYKGACSSKCPTGTYEDNSQCKSCTFPCVNCDSQNTCNQCLGGYLLYMNISCISDVPVCPNDFYKMDSKYCVPVTWCPSNYFIDETQKTCSSSCDRKKYTNLATKKCQDKCAQGWYAGTNLTCQQWVANPPTSLMAMSAISYIQSSYLYVEIIFNQTVQWIDMQTSMYAFSLVETRLLFTQYTLPQYVLSLDSPNSLKLNPSTYPQRMKVTLPAYRLKSLSTSYPLQNPAMTIDLPSFTHYSESQIYSGMIIGQFSQGISWFIMLLSFFFLFKNRLSDLYVLWDTVQLLYLLIFLDIQYPPNLNQFFKGLKYTHFTFLPSLLSTNLTRNASDSPFYAYSYDSSFLRNTGGLFFALVLVFGFLILLKLLQLLMKKVQFIKQKSKQYPYIKEFIYKGILRYRWHHISDVMFLTYASMTLFAFSQINFISLNPDNIFSNILAVSTIIVYTLWVILVGHKLFKHFKNISKGKMVNNLKCFYRGIQKENKFGISLVLIRYARKLFYSLIISIFSADPMFALPILMFTSVLMCLFLFINLPYKKRLSNIITLGSQIIIVIMYILLALINFNNETFDASTKHSFGWVCCILLAMMIFSLIYEIFCKTMFHLSPQVNPALIAKDQNRQKMLGLTDKEKQYLRRKAQQFFDSLLPRLREKLNFDEDSDDQLYKNYEQGDSQNSENNEQRQKDWNTGESHNSDEFKHYDNSSNSQDPTAINSKMKIQQAPQYLVRCVKDIE